MILRALYDYYHQSLAYDPDSMPRYGLMNVPISFIIVIKRDGTFVRIEDCRDEKGRGSIYTLPKGKHTNAITPYLFWDNCMYAIDFSTEHKPLSETDRLDAKKVEKWEKSIETAHKKHLSFVERCNTVYQATKDEELKSVVDFYASNQLEKLREVILWKQIEKNPAVYITFRIQGSTSVVANNPILTDFIEKDSEKKGVCLITGKFTDIVRKATPTPIPGCKSSASLVSFQKDSGYDSFGKEQAYNAPISLEAEFAFSTALLKLKEEGSRNKFSICDRLFLFWASSYSEASQSIESSVSELLDDPNGEIDRVIETFQSVFNGKLTPLSDERFYIAGLAPNSGRIAVVFYVETPLRKFAETILSHFDDMRIIGTERISYNYASLYSMLYAVFVKDDVKKEKDKKDELKKRCPRNLPNAVVKSIFQGLPYPATLYQACLRRIRATQTIKIVQAAIIKAYLNRLISINNNKKIDIMLDKENNNPGYLCGRLFAVLERIQELSNKDDNYKSNISVKYINSASSTPSLVFPIILSLSAYHIRKIANPKWLKDLQSEIVGKIKGEFPSYLDLQDQGRFFVGYYHQRQDFFTSKDEKITI